MRIACLVPFCRRTRTFNVMKASDIEWICSDHWRATDRETRRIYFRAKRRQRRARHWFWDKLKRQAIERAGGIS